MSENIEKKWQKKWADAKLFESDPDEREDFRHISYIRGACLTTVKGKGTDGYLEAMDIILEYLKKDR